MSDPRVSIIVPVHNSEKYLAETLVCALSQSWPNKEIIIVDDGSSDSSYEIAKTFQSQSLRVYRTENEGASAARNYGLAKATGEYIQYIDADDLMSPMKIESQLSILQNQPEGYVSSCFWGKFIQNSANAWFETQKVFGDFASIDWLVISWEGGGMMQTACWLVPKDIASIAGPWNEKLSLHDDGEYFARILLASKGVKFCQDATVYYRTNQNNSISRQRNRKAAESAFNVSESYRENILQHENTQRIRHALMMNYLKFIYEYHPLYTDLTNLARKRIQQLGFQKLPSCCGKKFKMLTRCFGFDNALKIREILALIKSKCHSNC